MTTTPSIARRSKAKTTSKDAAKTQRQSPNNETVYQIAYFDNKYDTEAKVREITWDDFVESLEVPTTRTAKDGAAFSSAIFNGTRANENVVAIQWLVLDYDKNADWEADLARWKDAGYIFAAHTTHSHLRETKTNPNAEARFRVVIPLAEPIPSELYPQLWHWAYKATSGHISEIDGNAKALSNLFFLPAKANANAVYKYTSHNGKLLDWRELKIDVNDANDKQREKVSAGDLVINENAVVDADKRDLLFELFPKAQATYEYKRKDLKDQSPSSYDMSLANFAANAQWSSQEICNLLISFRRKHGKDLKLREDYYARTIAKAQSDYNKVKQEQERFEAIEAPTSDDKAENLKSISTALGIEIKQIVKIDHTDEPTYILVMVDGAKVELESINQLASRRIFDNRVAARINKSINYVTPRQWKNLYNKMLASLTIVQPPNDASDESFIRNVLVNYLVHSYKPEEDEKAWKNKVHNREPAHYNGNAVFFSVSFSKYLKHNYNQDPTLRKLTAIFNRLGCVQITVSYRHDEKDYSLRAEGWTVPSDILDDYKNIRAYDEAEEARKKAKWKAEREERESRLNNGLMNNHATVFDSSREGT